MLPRFRSSTLFCAAPYPPVTIIPRVEAEAVVVEVSVVVVGVEVGTEEEVEVGTAVEVKVGAEVSAEVGAEVGAEVVEEVGDEVVAEVGAEEGVEVGADVGAVGAEVGNEVGIVEGATETEINIMNKIFFKILYLTCFVSLYKDRNIFFICIEHRSLALFSSHAMSIWFIKHEDITVLFLLTQAGTGHQTKLILVDLS